MYATFLQQPMTAVTDVLKREHEAAEKCQICFKGFSPEKRNVRDHSHYIGLYQGVADKNCNMKHWIPGLIPIVFQKLSDYDAYLFI